MTHEDHAHQPPGSDPRHTAHALHGTLALPAPLSETDLRRGIEAFLSELARALGDRGCRLIGHIKGVLEKGAGDRLFFSVTSFEEKARFKGSLAGEVEKIRLTLNVIVYGVGNEEVQRLVLAALQQHLGQMGDVVYFVNLLSNKLTK